MPLNHKDPTTWEPTIQEAVFSWMDVQHRIITAPNSGSQFLLEASILSSMHLMFMKCQISASFQNHQCLFFSTQPLAAGFLAFMSETTTRWPLSGLGHLLDPRIHLRTDLPQKFPRPLPTFSYHTCPLGTGLEPEMRLTQAT